MTEEAEVVDRPLDVCEAVHFYPSEQMRTRYSIPEARYAALCIGTQQNKQPILRVMIPIPDRSRRKKGVPFNLPPISIKHHRSGLSMEVGGGFPEGEPPQKYGGDGKESGIVFPATVDLTVWCDEEGTWGTWERRDG